MSASVPEWDLADRMRKSLRVAGIGVQEIAEYLGVGRNTVSTWINGKIVLSVQTQRLWALRCGVAYEWIASGVTPPRPPGGDGQAVPGPTQSEVLAGPVTPRTTVWSQDLAA